VQVTWVDWISVTGLPLALIGLYFTWRQARNAANSAEAVQKAVTTTERKIRSKQLMVLIPQLRWTVAELENAIASKNHEAARRQLDSWCSQVANMQGILTASDPEEVGIRRVLQKSVGLARVSEAALVKLNRAVGSSCSETHVSILAACDELNTWLGKNSTGAL
jgi:hypothetical protein